MTFRGRSKPPETEKREAATTPAIYGVLPSGARDVTIGAGAVPPDRAANEQKSGEDAVDEMDLRVTKFSRRIPLAVRMIFPAVFGGALFSASLRSRER